jgi:hypothetical protein
MPKQEITPVSERLLTKGQSVTSSEISIDARNNTSSIKIPRAGLGVLSDKDVCRITTEYFDNKLQRWVKGPSCTTRGGVYIDRNKNIVEYTVLNMDFPDTANRKIKVNIEALEEITVRADFEQDEKIRAATR